MKDELNRSILGQAEVLVTRHDVILQRSPVFPIHELLIVVVIFALIAGGLYWLAGAWGVVLLWGMGVLFLLTLVAAPIGLFLLGRQKISERQWPSAAAHFLGSLLIGLLWLAAVGYCGYRGYLALP